MTITVKCSNVQAADRQSKQLGQTDFKECKIVPAPPARITPQEHPNNCKLVLVSPDLTSVQRDSKLLSVINVNSLVVNHAHIVQGQPQRKGVRQRQSLKYVNNVSCVDQLCSVKLAPNDAQNLPVGARLNQLLETWEALGAGSKVLQMLKEGYTLPFQTRPNLTRSLTSISCYVHPHRKFYVLEALPQLTSKNVVELVKNQEPLGFYNGLFLVPKPNNKWRPILDLDNLNKFLKTEKINHKFRSHQTCLQHTQTLVALCQNLGWLVNMEKSELDPKQVFNFVGYQFDLKEGKVRPTLERWQTLTAKIRELLTGLTCPVWQLISLTGLLTATEKQVHLDRLHMTPIQWHLKQNWRVPKSLEKVTSVPRSLHPHLKWWLEESNVLQGQPLYPLKHALQLFTGISKEDWGTHLNDQTARGTWSLPESKLRINYLELKADILTIKEFHDLCQNNIVLIATDKTIVVAYINKQGG